MKPVLKLPGTKVVKLKYDELPSNVAFKFNLRRYTVGPVLPALVARVQGRPAH
jgi:hypothetical protein